MTFVSRYAHPFNICQCEVQWGYFDAYSLHLAILSPNIKQQVLRFSFGLIVNIWAATRKATGYNPVQSHLIDV